MARLGRMKDRRADPRRLLRPSLERFRDGLPIMSRRSAAPPSIGGAARFQINMIQPIMAAMCNKSDARPRGIVLYRRLPIPILQSPACSCVYHRHKQRAAESHHPLNHGGWCALFGGSGSWFVPFFLARKRTHRAHLPHWWRSLVLLPGLTRPVCATLFLFCIPSWAQAVRD